MTIKLPQIDVVFKQLSNTFIERSERGIAILIIKDSTDKTFVHKEYTNESDLVADKKKYTAENYQYLRDIMSFGTAKLGVIRLDVEEDLKAAKQDIDVALNIIEQKYKTGWIGFVGEKADYTKINTWVKAKATENLTFKTISVGVDGSNHECIVELEEGTVVFNDERGEKDIAEYIPSMIAIASVCNVSRGMTYYVCKNLKEIRHNSSVDTALNKGKMVLINDCGIVRIGLGINSLTTFDSENKFEDMRYIDIIEAIHMIKDDIKLAYKNEYAGATKNKLDNQMIFISAINTYLESLEDIDVLDDKFDNNVAINIEAQRKAWESVNTEAKTWDDTKVKNMAFKRGVFLLGDIKILGAMENLTLEFYVN